MAGELLSSVTGGSGGGFITKFASITITVASGQTGTYITLTPPSGQKVKLNMLLSTAVQTNLTTINIGGVAVVTSVIMATNLNNPASGNYFKIGGSPTISAHVTGGINEVLEVLTDVSTSSTTNYAYQFGE